LPHELHLPTKEPKNKIMTTGTYTNTAATPAPTAAAATAPSHHVLTQHLHRGLKRCQPHLLPLLLLPPAPYTPAYHKRLLPVLLLTHPAAVARSTAATANAAAPRHQCSFRHPTHIHTARVVAEVGHCDGSCCVGNTPQLLRKPLAQQLDSVQLLLVPPPNLLLLALLLL
jgi:hypothetical protein